MRAPAVNSHFYSSQELMHKSYSHVYNHKRSSEVTYINDCVSLLHISFTELEDILSVYVLNEQ